jgi:hypothetical protein
MTSLIYRGRKAYRARGNYMLKVILPFSRLQVLEVKDHNKILTVRQISGKKTVKPVRAQGCNSRF